jgi:DNA-binding PadR family transcriptional regulator
MLEISLTNAELALLSLIAERPRHGYEVEQVIEERGMRAWTDVAFSSIYFILNKLVKADLAASTLQPAAGRGPAKKVFHATPAGHAALREGVRQALSAEDRGGQRFLLGLSCLPLLTQSEIQQAFKLRQAFLAGKIEELSRHPAMTQPAIPAHVRAMFEYSLAQLRAELEWSQNFHTAYLIGGNHNGKIGS